MRLTVSGTRESGAQRIVRDLTGSTVTGLAARPRQRAAYRLLMRLYWPDAGSARRAVGRSPSSLQPNWSGSPPFSSRIPRKLPSVSRRRSAVTRRPHNRIASRNGGAGCDGLRGGVDRRLRWRLTPYECLVHPARRNGRAPRRSKTTLRMPRDIERSARGAARSPACPRGVSGVARRTRSCTLRARQVSTHSDRRPAHRQIRTRRGHRPLCTAKGQGGGPIRRYAAATTPCALSTTAGVRSIGTPQRPPRVWREPDDWYRYRRRKLRGPPSPRPESPGLAR